MADYVCLYLCEFVCVCVCLCHGGLADPRCAFKTTHLLFFGNVTCLSPVPALLLPLCLICSFLSACLTPRRQGAKKDIWAISPPMCSIAPVLIFCRSSSPSLRRFPLFVSLHPLCLCISVVFMASCFSPPYNSIFSLPLLPSAHTPSVFCASGTPGWLLGADT